MEIEVTGGTIEVRDKANVKIRRTLRAASADFATVLTKKYDGDVTAIKDAKPGEIRNDGELMNAMDDFGCTALVLLLEGWSFATKLPTTVPEWWEFEDADLYDELIGKITPIAYGMINPVVVPVSPEDAKDPNSPTVPFSDSKGEGPDQTTHMTLLPAG